MIRNQAGQTIGGQMTNAATGADFAGTVTVYVTIDAGIQTIGSVGSGICTNEGRGYYTYAPSATETDGLLIAFTFTGTGAVSATIQVATVTAAQNAAVSSSTGTGVLTVADLIRLALMRVNIVQPNEDATPEDQRDAFVILNLWLEALAVERLMIPFTARTLFTISSTKGTPTNPYTVGSGGDVNVAKPVFISQVSYVNNAVTPATEIPITGPITDDAYAGIVLKTQTATLPGACYYRPTYVGGLGSLFFYPIATQSNLQGALYAPSAVATFGSVADSVIVPIGYRYFLMNGLAVELASMLRENLPVDQDLKTSVRALKSALKAVNVPQMDMGFDPAATSLSGGRAWGQSSNIYNGTP